MPLLLRGRCILPGDIDHPSAHVLDAEARAPVVGAKVLHEGVVVDTNEHGRNGPQYEKGEPAARSAPHFWCSFESSSPRRIGARGNSIIGTCLRFSDHLVGGSLERFTRLRLGTGSATADHVLTEGWGAAALPP